MRVKGKNFYSIVAVVFILVVYSWHITNVHPYSKPTSVIAWDVRSYYAYLPATFIEKDYKLHFTYKYSNEEEWMYWPETAPNGGLVIKTSMGLSILYAPFFFIANHFAGKMGYATDGFSTPYAFALIFSCVFYLFIGFLFLRTVLLKYFNDKIVAATLLIIGLATNLFAYATVNAPMPHGYNFALFCVFLYLMEKWQDTQGWRTSIFLGIIIGFITLIRPTNALILILFLFFNISNLKDISTRFQLFMKNYMKIIVMIICVLLVWLPQLLYWKSVTGECLYYSYGGERFFFNSPKILQVLFGFRKGWFIYTPAMLFAVIGIGMLWKTNRKYFLPILLFFVFNLYIVSSWWCWWYGGGFGMRPLVESYAILAIPLAAFLAWLIKQKLPTRISLCIVVVAIASQSIFHNVQYYYKAIHYDSMTKEAYFDSFWRVKPSEKFESLLIDPDYESAREGKKKEVSK